MRGNVDGRRRARLSIDMEPELRPRIKVAAALKDLSVREYLVDIVRRALAEEEQDTEPSERANWSLLSVRPFSRDWDSEEDQVYDRLA